MSFYDTARMKNSINLWFPKVKPGGMIAGHDFFYPGVLSAVRDFSLKYGVEISNINSSWFGTK